MTTEPWFVFGFTGRLNQFCYLINCLLIEMVFVFGSFHKVFDFSS